MYEDESTKLKEYAERLAQLRLSLRVDVTKAQIADIEQLMSESTFWDDPESAQKILQKLKGLKNLISAPDALGNEIEEAQVLVELSQAENDESMAEELKSLTSGLGEKLDRLEIGSLFTDPRDSKAAIINVHPGAGGTESCDWAAMLYRMITRCCERHEFNVEVVDYQDADEAGLKSATIIVDGPFAYGNLKSEAGVHRLVRISPFDANKRRHTSFAAIEVIPQVDDSIAIEIKEDDLKMDVFRSSGPGGQKVNKTSSAVRLTHLPTGIVVACQIERSQHRNRATAMQMLKAKLYDIEMQKKEVERLALREGQQDVAWGSQIRSYVLHPYQLIKDHRTDVETSNVDRILDGDLDIFIAGFLKWKLELKGDN
ncbi:MAG: peptide chain release factor 2 [Candidatus Hydrogenedentales bacterium]|jgi:peptide chain release factor 2